MVGDVQRLKARGDTAGWHDDDRPGHRADYRGSRATRRRLGLRHAHRCVGRRHVYSGRLRRQGWRRRADRAIARAPTGTVNVLRGYRTVRWPPSVRSPPPAWPGRRRAEVRRGTRTPASRSSRSGLSSTCHCCTACTLTASARSSISASSAITSRSFGRRRPARNPRIRRRVLRREVEFEGADWEGWVRLSADNGNSL